MKTTKMLISMIVVVFAAAACVQAGVAVYDFDDVTLQGWTNVGTEDYIAWDTAANNNGGRTVARSGDYMLLEENFGDRDSDTNVKILSSPAFLMTDDTAIEIWTLGGTGAVATPTWTNYADLPTTAGSDFMGAALRRVSDGEYLLFSRRSAPGQSNRTPNWLAIGWDTTEIAAAIAGDSVNETYVVDVIDAYSGGWGWLGVDDATLTDVIVVGDNPVAINPDPEDGRDDVPDTTTLLDWDIFNATNPVTCDIYFGTDSAGQTWLETTTGLTDSQYTLQTVTLEKDETYYWRVDVHSDPNTFTGTLWSFDTELSLPQITSGPSDVMGAVGETVQFEVAAIDPLSVGLNYQWYKGQAPDTSSPVGDDSSILVVGPLAAADLNTTYYCAVSNTLGATDSQTVTILEKKMLAHWTLDSSTDPNSIVEGSPDTITNGEPVNVSGMIGQAMEFDGVDDFLYVPESGTYFDEMYNECTVSCWLKSNSTGNWSVYVGKYGESGEGWQLRDNGSTLDEATFTTRGTGNEDGISTGVKITDEQWHFVVGTFDGQTKNVYVDGLLRSSVIVSGPITPTEAPISIAARVSPAQDFFSGPFTGAIDDVCLYNYSMDKTAIAQVYADVSGETICPEYPTADLDLDCDVDLEDFAILATNWLTDNTVLPQ